MPYPRTEAGRKRNAAYQRKWYASNRKKKIWQAWRNKKKALAIALSYIAQVKAVGCPCGESDVRCLDFHHRNPKVKSFCIAIGVKRGFSLERIKKEIKKCDVICSNCHRKFHGRLVQRQTQ